MPRMRNIAEIMGYNKQHVWVKIPLWHRHVIFTMPRSWLKRGFATAARVEVEYDPKSASFNGTHFTADMEIINVFDRELDPEGGPAGSLGPESTGEEGE